MEGKSKEELELQCAAQYGSSAEDAVYKLGDEFIYLLLSVDQLFFCDKYYIENRFFKQVDSFEDVDDSVLHLDLHSYVFGGDVSNACISAAAMLEHQKIVFYPHKIGLTYEHKFNSIPQHYGINGQMIAVPTRDTFDTAVFKISLMIRLKVLDGKLKKCVFKTIKNIHDGVHIHGDFTSI